MQGWLSLILILALAALAVSFGTANQTEVTVYLPGGAVHPRVPLFVLAFVPLLFGFLIGAISGWSGVLKYHKRVSEMKAQIRRLEEELNNLRNLPLDNDLQL